MFLVTLIEFDFFPKNLNCLFYFSSIQSMFLLELRQMAQRHHANDDVFANIIMKKGYHDVLLFLFLYFLLVLTKFLKFL